MAVDPIGAANLLTEPGVSIAKPTAPGFGDTLGRLIEHVNTSAGEANDAVGRMLDGSGDVPDAMLALQRADLMLQLSVQVRNKLVQAYQEIMRMPI